MSSQLEDAFNEAVERRTAELRAALEFYANADNYVGGEVGWWADAPGGEQRWCMDFGSIARSALSSPGRPPFFTEQQERALARCEGYDEGYADRLATPDPPDPRLDAVYAERNAVVLGLAKAGLMLGWRVGKASDPNEPDWPVVYIDTPAGQVSWHFRAADVPDWVEPYPGEWDRHSDREKYERLSRLPTAPAASPDERLREAAGLLSRAKTALRAHRLNWLALSDRLDAPYPDRPDSSPWSRFALPVCQRGKAVEDEIVAALAAADREKPDEDQT